MTPPGKGGAPTCATFGVGFKPEHAVDALGEHDLDFFEIHAENYMGEGGRPHRILAALRERFPLSVHGVGLSIGGPGPLDVEHLERLAAVCVRYRPFLVSEHLAWSSHDGVYLGDLLPVAYTSETFRLVRAHVDQVQERLGRRILIENPSTYVGFDGSTLAETQFLAELAQLTGCGLLLDVANVHVSATNHGFDAAAYLDAFPLERVEEFHLSGSAPAADEAGERYLLDAHDRAPAREAWRLYARALERAPPAATLIEWDADVPSFPVLAAEAERARLLTQGRTRRSHALGAVV